MAWPKGRKRNAKPPPVVVPDEPGKPGSEWTKGVLHAYKVEYEPEKGFTLWQWTYGLDKPVPMCGPYTYIEEARQRLLYYCSKDK